MIKFTQEGDFITVMCKQSLKIEVQLDAKNKAHACSNCNHHSRYYSSCIRCSNNNVLSLLKQFITRKVRSNRIFGKNALFVVLAFWFPCIYRCILLVVFRVNFGVPINGGVLSVYQSKSLNFLPDFLWHILVVFFSYLLLDVAISTSAWLTSSDAEIIISGIENLESFLRFSLMTLK